MKVIPSPDTTLATGDDTVQNCRAYLTDLDFCLPVSTVFRKCKRSRLNRRQQRRVTTEHPCIILSQWLLGCRRRVKRSGSWGGRSPFRHAVFLQGTAKQSGGKKVSTWWTKPWILAVSEEPCLPALSKGCPRTGTLTLNAPGCILVWRRHLITTPVPLPGRLFWQHMEMPGRTSWQLTVPLNQRFTPCCAEED